MFRLRTVLLMLVSLVSICAAQEADFQKLAPVLREFRTASGSSELSIRLTSNSFQLLRRVETVLSGNEAKKSLPKEASFATLKISQEGNCIEHTVDQDTKIDDPLTANGSPDLSREWKKFSKVALGSFGRAAS